MGDEILSKALAKDYQQAILSERDRAMLDYAVKLTISPKEVGGSDVLCLKDAGFEDAAVLDICQVTAYYSYVNRLAEGLGVELETHWEEDLIMTEEEFKSRIIG